MKRETTRTDQVPVKNWPESRSPGEYLVCSGSVLVVLRFIKRDEQRQFSRIIFQEFTRNPPGINQNHVVQINSWWVLGRFMVSSDWLLVGFSDFWSVHVLKNTHFFSFSLISWMNREVFHIYFDTSHCITQNWLIRKLHEIYQSQNQIRTLPII